MIKDLIKLSNHLDSKGLRKEADYLDTIIKRSQDLNTDGEKPYMPTFSDLSRIDLSNSLKKVGDGISQANWASSDKDLIRQHIDYIMTELPKLRETMK